MSLTRYSSWLIKLQIKIKIEGGDDIWNLYNFLEKKDFIKGKITRKVNVEGTIGVSRKTFEIVLSIEEMEYDTEFEIIRIKGKNIVQNKYLQVWKIREWVDGTVPVNGNC